MVGPCPSIACGRAGTWCTCPRSRWSCERECRVVGAAGLVSAPTGLKTEGVWATHFFTCIAAPMDGRVPCFMLRVS